jgi:hypothetical protein
VKELIVKIFSLSGSADGILLVFGKKSLSQITFYLGPFYQEPNII